MTSCATLPTSERFSEMWGFFGAQIRSITEKNNRMTGYLNEEQIERNLPESAKGFHIFTLSIR